MESIPAPAARCRRRLLLADGVSVAAAPLAGACSPRRGHGYPQARGKNKGRARPAEGQRPSEFLRCPSGKSKPQTQDLLHACFNLAQDLNQVRIVPGQSSECSELRTCIEKAPTQASKLVSQNTQVPKQAWLSTPVTSRLGKSGRRRREGYPDRERPPKHAAPRFPTRGAVRSCLLACLFTFNPLHVEPSGRYMYR